MALSPSWAFCGQAVDGVGDPHLSTGMHYRVLTHPSLGLPVLPLAIGRALLGQAAKGHTRTDVTWVDAQGTIRNAPFTVTPDNPVTGYLPLGRTCCWAALEGRRSDAGPEPLRIEGMVATPLGDAPVAVRSRAPYHVYASHVERVVVRGNGVVTGFSWLPASAVDKFEQFRTAPLPTGPGARYAGPPDGKDEGFKRVERGAPQRFGMHESPLAPAPPGCDPLGHADEVDRVSALTGGPSDSLDKLINDTSVPQDELRVTETVIADTGGSLGTSDRLLLMDLIQGAVDPGIARWLGFLDVDEQKAPDHVMAYVVDALFVPDWKALDEAGLTPTLPSGAVVKDGAQAVRDIADRAPDLRQYADQVGKMNGPFLSLRIVLAATEGVPLDSPATPALGVPVPGDWLPSPAPAAIREITVAVDRLVPAAGIASAIAQPSGDKPRERNPERPTKRRLMLTARPDTTATTATRGVLADRQVDEQDGLWQVAQADWFGRWSGWAREPIAAAARPRPPRPVFTLTSRPPVVPVPAPTGTLAGTVRIEVSVPPVAGLPSGGRLLNALRLTVTRSGSGPVQTVHPLPNPAAPAEVLVVEVAGPTLLPTATGTAMVTAAWLDSAGVASDTSEPKVATLHDPRAPVAVVIPPALAYTARPDATGRARATLTWTPTAGQASFRVFFADETTLRAKLRDVAAGVVADGDAGQAPTVPQAQALLDALDAAADAPARGAVWDAARARLPRRWWRQLTAEPVPALSSGPVTFTHDVSGSLAVLALFRVVAVSAASVESDFRTSPLLPRGVPNLLVPPVPALAVMPVTDGSGTLQARLTVTVPAGPTPAVRYRLRRATATSDTMLMPAVAEGVVPPRPAGDPAPQVLAVVDPSLTAWSRYTWRVEVQGAPAPGGGPTGEWSSPSAAVTAAVMPPNPPGPVQNVSVTRDGTGVHVRFSHPEPLAAGGTTGYTVDVYRQLAGSSLRLLRSVPGQAPPPAGRGANTAGLFDIVDGDAGAVAGTVYRVVITDPLGRSSPPSPPAEAP
jgi:hypothetical protein